MPEQTNTTPCRLCLTGDAHPFCVADDVAYWRCPQCQATLMDVHHHPSRDIERAQYDLHENDVDDPGYRRFLAKLADPVLARLWPGSLGLDYGCGPGPALAVMLREAGHRVALYDPFFASDTRVLNRAYDFVTCTETAEHFHDPAAEFTRLFALVNPGGLLAIMTCFQTDDDRFATWHYRKDPTHVVFYREATFRWLAASQGWRLEIPVKDVVLMQRPPAKTSSTLSAETS